MADGRPTKLREARSSHLPKAARKNGDMPDNSLVQAFLKRTAEVTQKDHDEFSEYLQEKRARDQQQKAPIASAAPGAQSQPAQHVEMVAGTAVVGEAAAFGHQMITGEDIPAHGIMHSGATSAEALRHHIERELVNPLADIGGRSLGNWVLSAADQARRRHLRARPQHQPGAGLDLVLELRRLQSDLAPPLRVPERRSRITGFEFVNSTQGGKNCLIYGIPTKIETPDPGFNIYRVRYDGAQMELMENVSETTVSVLAFMSPSIPRMPSRYFVTDGQKDIAACFDRTTSRVIAALKFDWAGNSQQSRRRAGRRAACSRSPRSIPTQATGQIRLSRHQGPEDRMGNGADGRTVRRGRDHPRRRSPITPDRRRWHHLASDRPLGSDRDPAVRRPPSSMPRRTSSRWPSCNSTRIRADQYPVTQIDDDHWEVTFDRIFSPGHEVGFSPDGRFLCMMNNLRENNCSRLRLQRSRSAQLEKDRPYRGSALARQISKPVPHGVFARQLEALSVGPAPRAGHQRRHGGRHQDLDDQEGNPGYRAGHANPGHHL